MNLAGKADTKSIEYNNNMTIFNMSISFFENILSHSDNQKTILTLFFIFDSIKNYESDPD
jgi:hypothetical protein